MKPRMSNQSKLRNKKNPPAREDLSLCRVSYQELDCVDHTVDMAALHSMGSVDARSDKRVAGIIARPHCCRSIGTIERIDVDCVVEFFLFGQFHQPACHFIIVGTAGILGADGNIIFAAGQVIADTAHVAGDKLIDLGDETRPVTDLLISREDEDDVLVRLDIVSLHMVDIAEDAGNREFVIEKARFDKTVVGNRCLGIDADVVAVLDSKFLDVFLCLDNLVNPDLDIVDVADLGGGIAVYMGCRSG